MTNEKKKNFGNFAIEADALTTRPPRRYATMQEKNGDDRRGGPSLTAGCRYC